MADIAQHDVYEQWGSKAVMVNMAGKVNCKGRKYALTSHKTEEEAAKFARRLINGKIIEGYADPDEKTALKRSVSSFRMERRKSFQTKLEALPPPEQMYRMPHKKRKLTQQETVIIPHPKTPQEPSTDQAPEVKYRKPPRKQTTIRRNARSAQGTAKQSSLAQRLLKAQITVKSARTLSKMPTLPEEHVKLSRAPTLPAQSSSQRSKSVKKQKSKVPNPSAKRQSTVSGAVMPSLVTQETMPAGELNGGGDLAQDVRMKRKCRSYSMSAMPQTVVMRKK